MANKLYEESNIQAIADAIRAKNGSADTYTVAQMPAAIQALETGGGLSIDGFCLAGGTFSISGSGLAESARTITHNLTNSSGTPIVPHTILVYDKNTYYTMTGTNAYTKSILYDMANNKYYRRVVSNSSLVITLLDSTSDTTGLSVTNTTFVLPNNMYYAMHNFSWIAIGSDTSGTETVTCIGGYTS